jgi:hypothetical protein
MAEAEGIEPFASRRRSPRRPKNHKKTPPIHVTESTARVSLPESPRVTKNKPVIDQKPVTRQDIEKLEERVKDLEKWQEEQKRLQRSGDPGRQTRSAYH